MNNDDGWKDALQSWQCLLPGLIRIIPDWRGGQEAVAILPATLSLHNLERESGGGEMPLVRVEVRNEYGLGLHELYGDANREDPKAVLDGRCCRRSCRDLASARRSRRVCFSFSFCLIFRCVLEVVFLI
ncbi:hypothetical protein CK203_106289 [Vitis vinifera]|uniref:Uncharacterized protein n=1 Tax=Vitis vinifera TaxID=29760 RepID=A0A438BPS9_VITVI|nr:hypothetical protein CK203_106289 [Vitis vinifera]